MKLDYNDLFENSIVGVIVPIHKIAAEADLVLKSVVEEQFSMSFADFNIMTPILMLGGCTQADIARFNQISEAAVSKRISQLIKAGLVDRHKQTTDQRATLLHLTVPGEKQIERIIQATTMKMETICAQFPKGKRDQLRELLLELFPLIVEHSPRKDMIKKSEHPMVKKLFKRR